MKISIIVPTLNESCNIGRLVEHLLSVDAKNKELIVVDGGSTDNTLDIVEGFNVKIFHSASSRAKQLNLGAVNAKHHNLYFVHADTVPPIDFFDDIKKCLLKDKIAMCYRSNFVDGPKMLKLNAFFTRFDWLVSRGGDQSLFITKEGFESFGPYDEKMEIMEEYPLINKLLKANLMDLNQKKIDISTRKYINRSWLRVSRANYMAFKMFQKGKNSKDIKKRYFDVLENQE